MRRLGILIGLLVALMAAQSAHATTRVQTLTVVNQAHIPRALLVKVERAVQRQAVQLRAHWKTPLIRFGLGGWKVFLQRHPRCLSAFGNETWGVHLTAFHIGSDPCDTTQCSWAQDFASDGCPQIPYAIVEADPRAETIIGPDPAHAASTGWSNTEVFSHEIMEMLVDPSTTRYLGGQTAEICDPAHESYYINGVAVADFVFPSWFTGRSRKTYDQEGLITKFRQTVY